MPGTTPLRIGIDCRAIRLPAADGVSTYTEQVVQALAAHVKSGEEWIVFCRPETAPAFQAIVGEQMRVVSLARGRVPFVSAHLMDAWRMRRVGVDVVLVPGGMPPLFLFTPTVLVVHDLLIFDHPEWFPPQWFSRVILSPLSLRRARRLVAVSEETKKTIARCVPSASGRTRVIPPGVPHGASDIQGSGTHLLCLGTIEPRKNVPLLLDAYEQAVKVHPALPPLVLAGQRGWKDEHIMTAIQGVEVRLPGRVRYIGPVDAQQKNELLRTASALLFPTLGEGFGLPPVEAQAQGIPVVASDIPVLHETAGDGALFVRPEDTAGWVQAIIRISTDHDLRAGLMQVGKTNAARFVWQRTAEQLRQVIAEATS